MTETEIQKDILDLLDTKGLFHWRSEPVSRHGHRARPGTVGMPDIFCLVGGHLYGLEVKTPDGKPSKEQLEWGRNIEKAGGSFFIVRSIEDVLAALTEPKK